MKWWIEVTVWQDGRSAGRAAWNSVFREELAKEFDFSPQGYTLALEYVELLRKDSPAGVSKYHIDMSAYNEQGRLFFGSGTPVAHREYGRS